MKREPNPKDRADRQRTLPTVRTAAGIPLIYVPGTLIVPGNAAATARNILTSEMLFRALIVSELIGAGLFIFMVLALYRYLVQSIKTHASLMVIFVLPSVPITFLNVLTEIAALIFLHGASFLSVFDEHQRDAFALMLLGYTERGQFR